MTAQVVRKENQRSWAVIHVLDRQVCYLSFILHFWWLLPCGRVTRKDP